MDSNEPQRVGSPKGRTRRSLRRVFRGTAARRAIGEIEKDRRGWIRHGIAALAISGLGLGVAGAVALTGSANQASGGSAPGVTVTSSQVAQDGNGQGPTFGTRTEGPSRNAERKSLTGEMSGQESDGGKPLDGTIDMTARQDAQKNAEITDTSSENPEAAEAAKKRSKALNNSSESTEDLSERLSREERERRQEAIREAEKAAAEARAQLANSRNQGQADNNSGSTDNSSADTGSGDTSGGDSDGPSTDDSGDEPDSDVPVGTATFPLKSYSIAARFGQYGSWSRYHTGVDFSAPIGTTIYATGNGVITNAGSGSASGWAGNYVVIKFSNGQQMLFAHMASASVSVGQQVSAGQVIGHVGMTGRTFGPHTHVELYPQGVTPGDVYRAIDPMIWFNAHGL